LARADLISGGESQRASVLAEPPLHRLEQLRGVVADAVLEHDPDVLDIADPARRVALDDDEVGVLAAGDAADAILLAGIDRAVERGDLDRLDRREPGLDQQL